jgi:hypothetical protein
MACMSGHSGSQKASSYQDMGMGMIKLMFETTSQTGLLVPTPVSVEVSDPILLPTLTCMSRMIVLVVRILPGDTKLQVREESITCIIASKNNNWRPSSIRRKGHTVMFFGPENDEATDLEIPLEMGLQLLQGTDMTIGLVS